MPTNTEGKELKASGTQARAKTSDVYAQDELFRRRDDLQQRMPSIGRGTGFLGGAKSPYAASFQPQRMPGMDYANYEKKGPNIGGQLRAPMPRPGMVPAGTQPVVLPNPNTPAPTTSTDPATQADELLADINEARISEGLEPFETFEEFQEDIGIFENMGSIGMADGGYMSGGGISSLQPQGMFIGGLMAALGSGAAAAGGALAKGATALGGAAAKGMGGLKNLAIKGGQKIAENAAAGNLGGGLSGGSLSGKRVEDMTREELIEYIQGRAQTPEQSGARIIGKGITSLMSGKKGIDVPQLGEISLADGGPVYYPRMNGQISGPGTERSDDIPAMLSDGEFVVNAKALRGIGKMDGANGDKEDQRMKGARMMYAMQQAGEQAMRNS